MNITPPFGFTDIVALEQHHKIRPQSGVPASYIAQNAIPIALGEFPTVMRDQPIVFAPLGAVENPTGFIPVAVCGLRAGENLFIKEGQWDETAYPLAYLRRHPFCVAYGPVQADGQRSAIYCVEKSALADDGAPLFNADGSATEAWAQAQGFLSHLEQDLERTQQWAKMLHDLKVLEHFTMNAQHPSGTEVTFSGTYRVSEEKLRELPADQLRMLIERGAMQMIYAHLLSLSRFPHLVDRHLARQPAAPAANDASA